VPRGEARWRFDLHPRNALGAMATDGVTVFVAAARSEPEGVVDGMLYAFDVGDGSIRWHQPLEGLYGAGLELLGGVLLVRVNTSCERRSDAGTCAQTRPAAVLGLDPANGRERFRTTLSGELPGVRWTAEALGDTVFVQDRPGALRPLLLPAGTLGPPRVVGRGALTSVMADGASLLAVTDGRPVPSLDLVSAEATAPRQTRPVLYRGGCPALRVGVVAALPAFASERVTGAARVWVGTTPLWTGARVPERVHGCAVVEGTNLWQAQDLALVATDLATGRERARFPLTTAPTSELAVVADRVFYLSVTQRLLGVDLTDGHTTVSVPTGAEAVESLVLWDGRAVVATRGPGLVLGVQ
jgi:outer membrane protein assembly factor BamB